MYPKKLKTWLNQFKQCYFTYSKGFYHLPYNGQSAKSLIDSFDGFPFVRHFKEKQQIYSSNPFCQGGFYYQELEEGCWLMYSKIRYKANVAYDLIYKKDPAAEQLEGYYMLSLNNINNVTSINNDICHKFVCFPQYSWTFYKPGERHCDLNFKGAENKYITLYISEAWLQKNLRVNKKFSDGGLDKFIQSSTSYIIWPLGPTDEALENFDRFEKVMNLGSDVSQVDRLNLKYTTLAFIFEFFDLCKQQRVVERSVAVDYDDKFSMSKVERYLREHLFEKFAGVSFLAKKFGVSETKLKTEFRQLFGKPLYQYFQDRQMEVAKNMVLEDQMLIKDISFKLGYESPGKFAQAFKKCHGFSPSALNG
ncbi:AraC-type DNA-binding protein [Arachidicoccus rhizosphaerae]|uniref:AraC-type DNA-binding protein n=1 Tax=Arachidicoccus rhizosphaerae TaxID=551991 RepID=A0A1H3VH58_9BACT|nr:AraC family transcriptional regulator [Arachidicoccus rhizosphaerae]SDZ74096.1 AraC-type DNA-binding protein [Arachidicoccus rhizosphaerae]